MISRLLFLLLSFLFAAASACDDIPPSAQFTCAQQAQWGKCKEPWMNDKCKKSCNRCADEAKPATPSSVPGSALPSAPIRATPINPRASNEAKKLYTALLAQYGKKILSGQQHDTNEIDYIREHSGGKEPVIKGFDFMDTLYFGDKKKQKAYMQSAIEWVKKKGGVVSFCWHWRNPLGTPNVWKTLSFDIEAKRGNDPVHVDLNQLPNQNSNVYKAIIRDIDHVAKYLKQAQRSKVPILFRPLHEAQGNAIKPWFWWGEHGPEKAKELYGLVYTRLVQHHKLNNLLWVWTTNSDQKALDWYPGDDRVDVLGMDLYSEDQGKDPHDTQVDEYKKVKELFKNKKMIALSEHGGIPDPAKMTTDGANWSWFCTWAGQKLQNEGVNAKAFIKTAFQHERVLSLGQFKV